MSLADDILAADDLPRERIEIPEWTDKPLYVRSMTGLERDAFDASLIEDNRQGKRNTMDNIRARMAVLCLVDESGERVFRNNQARDLGRKSGLILGRIFEAAQRLNGMSEAEIEDITGNSEGEGSVVSISG